MPGDKKKMQKNLIDMAENMKPAEAGLQAGEAQNDNAVAEAQIRALIASGTPDIAFLADRVRYHNERYNAGNPEISDDLYDALTERLRSLSPDNPALDELTTPEVNAGERSKKVMHDVAMLSLEKLKKGEEFKGIAQWLRGFEGDFLGSPKIDGLACSLVYGKSGKLSLASTRGDGKVGEDITDNVYYIADIPKSIPQGDLEVRGEVYMPLSAFRAYEGEKISARNLAVGGLKQKDARLTANYGLSFFAYEALGHAFATDSEKFETLRRFGFKTIETHLFRRSGDRTTEDVLKEVRRYCDEMAAARQSWDFDADGLVFKIDDNRAQREMGVTAHHPKCAVAYKFACDAAKTVLRDVLWQVAKGGTQTPVAVFDGVELAGANVRRATLSNAEQVESFPVCPPELSHSPELPSIAEPGWAHAHLRLGDILCVSRRGDVIPHVEYIVSSSPDNPKVIIPQSCASCGSPLLRDGKFLRCSEPGNCPTTGRALIENYVKVTGILGFGEKIISYLYDEDLISVPSDLYRLTPEDIAQAVQDDETNIDGSARLPQKLYQSIQSRRLLPLATFLEALSIPALGKTYSALLAQTGLSIEAIMSLDETALTEMLKGRALTAQKIYKALKNKRGLIASLLAHVTIDSGAAPEPKTEGPFSGMTFLFTGTLASMKREEAQKRAEALGASIASGVSKKLSVLVSTTDKTSKWTKAEALNAQGAQIALWTEEEFLRRLDEAEK